MSEVCCLRSESGAAARLAAVHAFVTGAVTHHNAPAAGTCWRVVQGIHGLEALQRVETDAEGAAYEAHMTKADGTQVTVKVDASFKVVSVINGMG